MKACFLSLSFLILLTISSFNIELDPEPNLSVDSQTALKMGKQIWQNECAGKTEGLTSWNKGEEFASLGIGHFIWYPEGLCSVFKQTFPNLLLFFKSKHAFLPSWLSEAKGCPWKTREEFMKAQQDPRMIELRVMLQKRIDLQIQFMVERMQRALPCMIQNLREDRKKHVMNQFFRLAETREGLFVLLDYINFKGEGVLVSEQYNGKGWGLLQVLEMMPNQTNETSAVNEFVQSSKYILRQRVDNSPRERNEEQWLKGWYNRLDGYLNFTL